MAVALDSIQQALDTIRPMIQSHGGDIELVELKDNIVYIRFLGACASCPISAYTLKLGVEEQIKEAVPSVKGVVAVE